MIKKLFGAKKPLVRQRSEHCISRKNIDADALRVLYRLSEAGHTAYLVGGSVRDLLLGRAPKDFDIGTNAPPNAIRKLFRNCFLVGKRFRLAHIVFGRKVIETSTFRRQPREEEDKNGGDDLYQREDNDFGTPQEDALRRDFTVNGLFYDIKTFAVIDYVGGLRDLDNRVLRSIGDPNVRFREDPVRMMRAIRLSARLGFSIDWQSRRAIKRHHAEIAKASVPRLLEELLRLFTYRSSEQAFRLMWSYGLLADLAPEVATHIRESGGAKAPLWQLLQNLDQDPLADDASAGLRLAVLSFPIFERLSGSDDTGSGGRPQRLAIARKAIEPFVRRLRIPKATFFTATNLLDMQARFSDLPSRSPQRCERFARHTLFPEAFALWRITSRHHANAAQLQAEWEKVAANVEQHITPHEEALDESDAAWRFATGAAAVPRHGFDGRRRRRPRHAGRRRDTAGANDASQEKIHETHPDHP